MRFSLLLFLLLAPMAARPQSTPPECMSPRTTLEINACAKALAEAAEADMLSQFSRLMESLARSHGGSLGLERAQEEWVRYRNAQCNFAYGYALGGTAATSYALSCQTRLNRARAEELRGIREDELL